ncbi:MAG: GNAT family N-acetyltransferase [Ornithinimicrobium sp.]|uniref:GNAT family N-acetyltransferase n=1 Tax=Ornithinimicrobium sp. TaxID=1977084 RepID=UPI003D9ADDEF
MVAAGRPGRDELLDLYDSVGWSAYTREPETLSAAIEGSSYVVTARQDGALVGLARVISDGVSICYLQDVLVRPTHRRVGLGRRLVRGALRPYTEVWQKVLLTDDEPGQRAFYESLGYAETRDLRTANLRAFVRFDL